MTFITAEQARVFTDVINNNEEHGALRELFGKIFMGKNKCTIYLGTELTEEEVEAKMQSFRDLGFDVYNYNVCTVSGGGREPEYTHPAEHRCDISW